MAGVSSDGLKTTVLPSSKLGPSIQSGTANGKFHGVMTATTPHGLRRMKASFSAISEASTSPIGMRPVPKTYWIMCRPSTTSARHSVIDLAALAGHEAGQVVGLALDDLGEVVEQLAAADAAGAPPDRESGPGGRDRLPGIFGSAARKLPEDLIGPGWVLARKALLASGGPLTGDQIFAHHRGKGGLAHDD